MSKNYVKRPAASPVGEIITVRVAESELERSRVALLSNNVSN